MSIPSVPAGDLLTAAGKLRDSREALPEHLRVRPWLHYADQIYAEIEGHDHVFAWTDVNRLSRPKGDAETAAHVALVASPHVTEALERLLEAIDALEAVHDHVILGEAAPGVDLWRRARALAAAINHTGRD